MLGSEVPPSRTTVFGGGQFARGAGVDVVPEDGGSVDAELIPVAAGTQLEAVFFLCRRRFTAVGLFCAGVDCAEGEADCWPFEVEGGEDSVVGGLLCCCA